jgi:hypothetical protein
MPRSASLDTEVRCPRRKDVIPSPMTGAVSAAGENDIQWAVRRVARGRPRKRCRAEPVTKLTQVRPEVADCCPLLTTLGAGWEHAEESCPSFRTHRSLFSPLGVDRKGHP